MEHLELHEELAHPIDAAWAIVGTLDRVDWVPSVSRAEMRGNERHMHMEGAGELVETIFLHDPATYRIEYGVTESTVGLTHHRATLQLHPTATGCTLTWQLEVEPDAFAKPIGATMRDCVGHIKRILDAG